MNKHVPSAEFFVVSTDSPLYGQRKPKPLRLQLNSADYGNGLAYTLMIGLLVIALVMLAVPPVFHFATWVGTLLHPPTWSEIVLDNKYLGLNLN